MTVLLQGLFLDAWGWALLRMIDLKTLLDAQDARRNSETALWDAQLNQRINQLKLWQALGGPPEAA